MAAPCTETSEHFHKDGCLNKLVAYFKDIAMVLGGVGIGVAIVQVIVCCLNVEIKINEIKNLDEMKEVCHNRIIWRSIVSD